MFAQAILAMLVLTQTISAFCGVPSGKGCKLDGVQLVHEWAKKGVPRSYSGIQKAVFIYGGKESVWVWRIWRDAAGRMRTELIEPETAKGNVVISDGKTVWHIVAGGKVVIQSRDVFKAPWDVNMERLDLLLQNYRVNVLGKDEVSERECYIISFEPYHGFNPSRKVWLDSGIYIPLKVEDYNPDGSLAWRMEYQEFTLSEHISPSLFQLNLPKESKVVNTGFSRRGPFGLSELPTDLGFTPLLPTWLPPGYIFDKAFVIEMPPWRGGVSLQLIYTNGLGVISVFESKSIKVRERPQQHRYGRQPMFFMPQGIVHRRVGDVNVVLVSRISRSVLERMASSITAPTK
ncbi:MAG: hypothetical protein GDYSWBUE_001078 [Candidatus Fervidibacterota bacterium]